MIAYCGVDCEKCEAHIATVENNDTLRAEVAAKWSEMYNIQIDPAYVNCTGCKSDGKKVHYCEHICKVRSCISGKGLMTCADCALYSCNLLEEIFKFAPQAKRVLNALRNE